MLEKNFGFILPSKYKPEGRKYEYYPRKGVYSQYFYLVNNGADEFLDIKNNPIEFKLFDLVYLNYDDDTAHVMMITGFDENGEPLLSGNTNDRIALPFYDAIKTYDDVRIVRINIP